MSISFRDWYWKQDPERVDRLGHNAQYLGDHHRDNRRNHRLIAGILPVTINFPPDRESNR